MYNSMNNRPNPTINHTPYMSMDQQNSEYAERISPQRRVMRQSTIPANITHMDQYSYQNTMNLLPPPSPDQQHISPQYSPYNTDSEDIMDASNPDLQQIRYPIRRQSTLPNRATEHHYQQQAQQPKLLPISPNRTYSRSTEKCNANKPMREMPAPFVRQSTFPTNASSEQPPCHTLRPKILPTSPSRINYNKSPEHGSEPDFHRRNIGVIRQNTLPNPEQQHKLLPTSPPKRQLSPQHRKRSPEIIRQNTLPNPDNSLSVPPTQTKFLPISPRVKQSFIFPQSRQHPRQFLSQQNVPTTVDDPYSSTGSVTCLPRDQQIKMMKVRSHSNEEYTITRPIPTEGRRLLPEIPRNRSRSPSRLVRQDNVREDARGNVDQRSPSKRTFVEAANVLPDYDEANPMHPYSDNIYNHELPFLEADEDESLHAQMFRGSSCVVSEAMQQHHQHQHHLQQQHQYARDDIRGQFSTVVTVQSSDSYPPDTYAESEENAWYLQQRRQSRDSVEKELEFVPTDDHHRRRPETMRSISEDTQSRNTKQTITRRTFSHPERDIQNVRRMGTSNELPPKLPSPNPFGDMKDRKKPTILPSPRCKNFKSVDITDTSTSFGNRNYLLQQRRDSKSFDSAPLYRQENDITNESNDNCNGVSGTIDDRKKIKLPTPPVPSSAIPSRSPETKPTTRFIIKSDSSSNQCTDDETNNKADDANGLANLIEPIGEHKTTLGEAEIQNAVEAAAVIFKKVVLQRRAAKTALAKDDAGSEANFVQSDDISDQESCVALKRICPESGGYKIVFISSDSSSMDGNESETSSTCNTHSSVMSDCDWDYFDPNATTALSHDTDIDTTGRTQTQAHSTQNEDFADIYGQLSRLENQFRHLDSANDGGSDCSQALCDCGHQPTYIPILVPVPILIPNNCDNNATATPPTVKRNAADATYTRASTAYNSQKHMCSGAIQTNETQFNTEYRTKQNKSAHNNSNTDGIYMNKMPIQNYQHIQKWPPSCNVSAVQMSDRSKRDKGECRIFGRVSNNGDAIFKMPGASNSTHPDQFDTTILQADASKDMENTNQRRENRPRSKFLRQNRGSREIADYSAAENAAPTSSCESESSLDGSFASSSTGDESTQQNYDLIEANDQHDSDVQVYGSSDCEDFVMGSGRQQPSTSSAVEASESDADADRLYGTVHTEKRPKSKSFYKVFVVNKVADSSESDSPSTNVNSTDDSSDNDTDTEKDCGIVLNYIKSLPECSAIDKRDCSEVGHRCNESNLSTVNSTSDDVVQSVDVYSSNDENKQNIFENVPNDDDILKASHNIIVKQETHSQLIQNKCTHDQTDEPQSEIITKNNAVSELGQSTANENIYIHDIENVGNITNHQIDIVNTEMICDEGNESNYSTLLDKNTRINATMTMDTPDMEKQLLISQPDTPPSNIVNPVDHDDVISGKVVDYNNMHDESAQNSLADYFTRSLEADITISSPLKSTTPRRPIVTKHHNSDSDAKQQNWPSSSHSQNGERNYVNDSFKTYEIFRNAGSEANKESAENSEDGLADDDSWVDSADDSEPEYSEAIPMCNAVERDSIDFTLHTIIEESCDESEMDNEKRKSVSELERYYFFGLADGKSNDAREDSISETSSLCSEGVDSTNAAAESIFRDEDIMSSRLEKYFLSTFLMPQQKVFPSNDNRDGQSDGSGSVGSDSEGHNSPEQRRKRLVRARGDRPRSHSSSLDNLLAAKDEPHEISASHEMAAMVYDSVVSSETDTCDETVIHLEKDANPNDTIKKKKPNKAKKNADGDGESSRKTLSKVSGDDERNEKMIGLIDGISSIVSTSTPNKKQYRDSGFIGSNDDLPKTVDSHKMSDMKTNLEEICEETKDTMELSLEQGLDQSERQQTRKEDSLNIYSSDEETNLMMSKLRQFVKTLIASNANAQYQRNTSKASTPIVSGSTTPTPRARSKTKPPQLVYFENELSRLMKSVPGIQEHQVREIVEYLSSEDTWSDSYDSSDISSDVENVSLNGKSVLQEQISESCQQIIQNFDGSVSGDREGDIGDGALFDTAACLNHETALVYQKLMASFSKMSTVNQQQNDSNRSPPIFARVMGHIGERLVALMHEVSSTESHVSQSPKPRYHKKLQQKISITTTDDDDDDDTIQSLNVNMLAKMESLPRSKSHDLLLSESKLPHHRSIGGVSDTTAEEKEASDYDRISWRGSFESALLATNADSRNKLTLLDRDNCSSASALAAKRRSAGDLLFNQCNRSREQLDRVRSCGSIGGGFSESPDETPNRSAYPDSDSDSSDDGNRSYNISSRSTLPRLQSTYQSSSTNSLPRSSNTASSKNVTQFLPSSAKSARYRPPGFSRTQANITKKAHSTPGLTSLYTKRDNQRSRRMQTFQSEDTSSLDSGRSPIPSKSDIATPPKSPREQAIKTTPVTPEWPAQSDEDIDRLVAMHRNRNSLGSLGLRSDSMASVYSGAGDGRYGTVAVKGQIEFGMQYNYKAGALEIYVTQCKDLAAVDAKRNRSDPYVKVYLLPDKSKNGKRKTKVKKHTLNPMFDETLKYYLPLNLLETKTLWVSVWHSDIFGRNDFLGEVNINLQGKIFDDPQPQWYTLQERSEPFEDVSTYRGEIIVALKFVPPDSRSSFARSSVNSGLRKFGSIKTPRNSSTSGTLYVLVKEAKNLSALKPNGLCDAFCKSYLLPDKNRNSKQKTAVGKRTLNPIWNHTFTYEDVSLHELSERGLELTIWDHDRLASNEFLGGMRLSLGTGKFYGKLVDWNDSTGKELTLWQSMINRPNFWVEGCIILRPSLDNIRNTY